MEGYGIMEIIVIEESVCPRCDESGRGIDYIISEGHCKHVLPRTDGTYLYYEEEEEEES
tara:strand:- start:66 stop:242 length:177 start_codon:yes stop_codon:yes gene_type:complete